MSADCFNELVLGSDHRLAMPIVVYPGLSLTGAKVRDIVTNPQLQFETQLALHERFRTPFVLSAMDLSVEAEAFGCTIHQTETEIPSVTGRLVTDLQIAKSLPIPKPGDKRTAVYLETVSRLSKLQDKPLVLAGCIGPFSLAARLVGVSEALEMTLSEPDLVHVLLEKCTAFLTDYLKAFRQAGAGGVIMAEPASGLLSPRGLAQFSSAYVKSIGMAMSDGSFGIILHNCAAKLVHLPAVLETGLQSFHFGAPMDIAAALGKVPHEVVLCGNLDPTAVFVQMTPIEVGSRTAALLEATASFRNFVVSSGCDVPPGAPLSNLDAFFEAAANCAESVRNP
jgi:uroporphyrinogen decarboxylase